MRLVTRQQWGAQPLRGTPDQFQNMDGVMIHWRGGGTPAAHNQCAQQIRDQQRRDQGSGHKDIMYNAVVCVHGYVYEGRPRGTAGSANGPANQANFRLASVCAWWFSRTTPPPAPMVGAMQEAVTWIAGWRVGPINRIVPHSSNVATECPGDFLRTLITQGRFRPGQTPSPQPPQDWFDMATEADLRRAIRAELNMGQVAGVVVPQGQSGWGATNRWMGGMLRDIIVRLGQLQGRSAATVEALDVPQARVTALTPPTDEPAPDEAPLTSYELPGDDQEGA